MPEYFIIKRTQTWSGKLIDIYAGKLNNQLKNMCSDSDVLLSSYVKLLCKVFNIIHWSITKRCFKALIDCS